MIFTIDVGNTNIVLGVVDETNLIESFRIRTDWRKTSDEYAIMILEFISYLKIKREDIKGAIICSVVPSLNPILELMLKKHFNITPLFVGPGLKTGIELHMPNPREVGPDILVGLVAAGNKYGFPTIAIDMGTATTLAYCDKNKTFYGGIIICGIKTAFNELVSKTSMLQNVAFIAPKQVINPGTVEALQSGAVYGYACMIDGLIRKIKAERGEATVVLTGGEARIIKDYLEEKVIYDDDLVSEGLIMLYNKNVKK